MSALSRRFWHSEDLKAEAYCKLLEGTGVHGVTVGTIMSDCSQSAPHSLLVLGYIAVRMLKYEHYSSNWCQPFEGHS